MQRGGSYDSGDYQYNPVNTSSNTPNNLVQDDSFLVKVESDKKAKRRQKRELAIGRRKAARAKGAKEPMGITSVLKSAAYIMFIIILIFVIIIGALELFVPDIGIVSKIRTDIDNLTKDTVEYSVDKESMPELISIQSFTKMIENVDGEYSVDEDGTIHYSMTRSQYDDLSKSVSKVLDKYLDSADTRRQESFDGFDISDTFNLRGITHNKNYTQIKIQIGTNDVMLFDIQYMFEAYSACQWYNSLMGTPEKLSDIEVIYTDPAENEICSLTEAQILEFGYRLAQALKEGQERIDEVQRELQEELME